VTGDGSAEKQTATSGFGHETRSASKPAQQDPTRIRGHALHVPPDLYVATAYVRVGYVDTDQGQVVHHGTYLRYLEMSRVEYLRERGCDYRKLEREDGLGLPVVDVSIRYRASAHFDDLLEIKTWIAQGTRAKLRFDSIILRGAEVLTTAQITLCCVKMAEQKLCSMPDALLAYAL